MELKNVYNHCLRDRGFKVTIMAAPRVFAGMFITLIVFAIATYWMTDSLFITLLETIASAILLQLGYFLCIGFLVWRQSKRAVAGTESEAAGGVERTRDEHATRLPGSPFNQSGPFGR